MKSFSSQLVKIAQLNSKERDTNLATQRFCVSLFNYFGLTDLVIYLNTNNHKLKQEFALGLKSNKNITLIKNPLELKFGQGVVGTSAESLKTRCIKDIKYCSDYVKDITDCESELAVPLVYKGDLIGVLDSENSNKHFFTSSHIEAFHLVSHFISPLLYIDNKKSNSSPINRFKEFKKNLIEDKLYLNCNLSQSSMAESIGVSSQYLASLISQFSSQSFSHLVAELRVNNAKQLLLDPDYSSSQINQIAYESGFSSKSSFNRLFKSITGITPSEYSKSKY